MSNHRLPLQERSEESREPSPFVTRSVVRPGLKREFIFALKSQLELGVASSPRKTRRTAATNHASAVPTTCDPPRQQHNHEAAAVQKETFVIPTLPPGYDGPRQRTTESANGRVGVDGRGKMPLGSEGDGREKIKEAKMTDGSIAKPVLFRMSVVELLRTGLLDGQQIKCIVPGVDLETMLQGKIIEGKIICYCKSCIAKKEVDSYQFEEHCNIMEGHPAEFIFFENGRTCLDILKSFTMVSMCNFDSLIREVVGPRPKMIFTCRICGEEVDAIQVKNYTLVCDSCLGASHETSTSSTSNESSSNGSSSNESSSSTSRIKKTPLFKRAKAGKSTKKNLHRILFEDKDVLKIVKEKKVEYIVGGKILLEGELRDSGIYCFCCKEVISPSQFEDHAGHSQKRKPYHHIYLPDGLSLHDLTVHLSSKLNPENRKGNDAISSTCKEEPLDDVASTSVKVSD